MNTRLNEPKLNCQTALDAGFEVSRWNDRLRRVNDGHFVGILGGSTGSTEASFDLGRLFHWRQHGKSRQTGPEAARNALFPRVPDALDEQLLFGSETRLVVVIGAGEKDEGDHESDRKAAAGERGKSPLRHR